MVHFTALLYAQAGLRARRSCCVKFDVCTKAVPSASKQLSPALCAEKENPIESQLKAQARCLARDVLPKRAIWPEH